MGKVNVTIEQRQEALLLKMESSQSMLNKLLKGMTYMAVPIILAVVVGWTNTVLKVDRNEKGLTELRRDIAVDLAGNFVSKDKIYRVFVQKVDALAVHMFETDWINTQLYKITSSEEYKDSEARQILIDGFFNETHRGAK